MKLSNHYIMSSVLVEELEILGYKDRFDFQEGVIVHIEKSISFKPNDLIFVDAGFYNHQEKMYVFAISSPLYDLKGMLLLSKKQWETLYAKGYKELFSFEYVSIDSEIPHIAINRQYGMRKILKNDFDQTRYELRVGFPDYPPCPYGHTFKALGYDKINKEYVRLANSILKEGTIQTIQYQR